MIESIPASQTSSSLDLNKDGVVDADEAARGLQNQSLATQVLRSGLDLQALIKVLSDIHELHSATEKTQTGTSWADKIEQQEGGKAYRERKLTVEQVEEEGKHSCPKIRPTNA